MAFETEIVIAWGDCDPAGIVYYPRYFYWFDTTFQRWLQSRKLSQAVLQQRFGVLGTGLLDAQAQFRATARDGDRMTVEATITDWHEKSFRVEYCCRREETLLVEGHETRGWLKVVDGSARALPIPHEFKALLE